jgi:DNA-binding transcriptional MerR regulator
MSGSVNGVEPPIYSISAVERMVGVPAATLRNWEGRYGLIRPERSDGGHRLYTRSQVEQLTFVAVQVTQGLHAAEAHRLLEERIARHEPVPAGGGDPRLLILLAERDAYAAEFAEFFLRTEGYDVVLAFDADETMRIFEQRSPELVVVELLISGGAGTELVGRLKQNGATACLAVSTLDARESAFELGADAFLQKPLDPLQLVSTVKDLLGTSAYLAAAPKAVATSPA